MNTMMQQNGMNFDFENNKIETMNLETLMRTHKENDVYGKPLKGFYHYEVITRIADTCKKYDLNYNIEEIFAAQNKNKTQPGVVILPQIEQIKGEKSIEAHILRRLYTSIEIKNWQTDELTTNLVIAYHQDGIQVAIGPCVKICHNQCILSPERSVANYGKNKVTTDELFVTVDRWLSDFEVNMTEDRQRIKRLQEKVLSSQDLYAIIGLLTAYRVAHDSEDKGLSAMVNTYPLNQGQISVFTEDVLKLKQQQEQITAWDIYNIATEIYKPEKTEFPALIPQNTAFMEMITSYQAA